MPRYLILALGLLVAAPAAAQPLLDGPPPQQAAPLPPRLIGRPDTAVKLAYSDAVNLQQQDPAAAAAAWYIWFRDSQDTRLLEAYDYVLNTALSRADTPLRSTKIRGGAAGTLLRIDRRFWLPEVSHQENFLSCLEGYLDPQFYVKTNPAGVARGFTPDEIASFQDNGKGFVLIPSEPYELNGETYQQKWVKKETLLAANPGFDFSPAVLSLATDEANGLRAITGMNIPIVEAERWLVFSLRNLQGGLYYRLQGYDDGAGKRLNQAEWLALFGADEQASEALGGEELIGMWRSSVTGKPRRAKFIYGRSTRPSVGAPLIVITEDGNDEATGTEAHPIYSLFDVEFDATEILATKPNGTIAYGLFAGDGSLQDAAPDNVVKDHKVPPPHTSRLEPAISCIRCHAGDQQWKPMPNHVKQMLSTPFAEGQRLGVATDFGAKGKTADQILLDLQRLYSGDLTWPLKIARDSHELATIRMVDFKLVGDGYADEAAARLVAAFNHYVYDPITPVEALRSLGVVCDERQADELLAQILPVGAAPGHPVLTDPAVVTLRLHKEDPTLVLNRSDWERIYASVLGTAILQGSWPGELAEQPQPPVTE